MTFRRATAALAVAAAVAAVAAAPARAVTVNSGDAFAMGARLPSAAVVAGANLSLTKPGVLGAQVPATVTVAGSGLGAGADYDVDFDTTNLTSVTTDGTGAFTTHVSVPPTTCGDHTISITFTGPVIQLAALAADASAVYHVFCPRIAVTPARVLGSSTPSTFTVLPNVDFDFGSNDITKTLFLDGAVLGTFGYKKPIAFPAAPACGVHTVRLVQFSDFGLLDASAPFTVNCPTVAVTPNVIAKTDQPRAVTLDGSSFDPKAAVRITIDGSQVATGVTDGLGTLSRPVPVRGLDCGRHRVTVTETLVPAATATGLLFVRCTTRSAAIALNPVVVAAGMTTHVTGSGFTPGATVSLVWKLREGGTQAVVAPKVVADSSGRVDFFCLVLQHEDTGARTLIASDSGVDAKADAVVQGGTMQPSGGGPQLVFRR